MGDSISEVKVGSAVVALLGRRVGSCCVKHARYAIVELEPNCSSDISPTTQNLSSTK